MDDKDYTCPSAPASDPDNHVFGVVLGEAAEPRVAYLAKGVGVDAKRAIDRLDVDPGHVFRFAGKCASSGCAQWKDGGCRLGRDVAAMLEPVVDTAPACTIRSTCRWFAENGVHACLRCPQVTTHVLPGAKRLYEVANMVPQPGRKAAASVQPQEGPSA